MRLKIEILLDLVALVNYKMFNIFNNKLSKISKFYNLHKNQDCYIFGDGCSIKWFDIENFSDKIGIAINFFPFHKKFLKTQTKYVSFVEPFYFYPFETIWHLKNFRKKSWLDNITKTINHRQFYVKKIFDEFKNLFFFVNLSNYPTLFNKKNIIFFYKKTHHPQFDNFFTNAFESKIDPFSGSIRFSISLAIFMGFKECYLVGCDYTHSPSFSGHWYEKGFGKKNNLQNYNNLFFEIARKYIKIITIVKENEKSDYIDYINYENFTGKKLNYKENTELAENSFLKVMSTWPGYEIF